MKKLDDKGFVFIDDRQNPFWIRTYNGIPKLLYWNEGQKSWVILRDATYAEIWQGYDRKIPDEQAEIYHQSHKKFEKRIN